MNAMARPQNRQQTPSPAPHHPRILSKRFETKSNDTCNRDRMTQCTNPNQWSRPCCLHDSCVGGILVWFFAKTWNLQRTTLWPSRRSPRVLPRRSLWMVLSFHQHPQNRPSVMLSPMDPARSNTPNHQLTAATCPHLRCRHLSLLIHAARRRHY